MRDKIFIIDDADGFVRTDLDSVRNMPRWEDSIRNMFRWWCVSSVEPLSGDAAAVAVDNFIQTLICFCGADFVGVNDGVITVKNGADRKYSSRVFEILKRDTNYAISNYLSNPGTSDELRKLLFPYADILVSYHRIPMDFDYFLRVVSSGDDDERRIVVSDVFEYKAK